MAVIRTARRNLAATTPAGGRAAPAPPYAAAHPPGRTLTRCATPPTQPATTELAILCRLVRLLKHLGYRARQRTVSNERFFPAVAIVRSKIQLGLNAWGADFPTASDYFIPS